MTEIENNIKTFTAAGKLMLFGEYLVLNGANCLAFPLKFGQTLAISPFEHFYWESFSPSGRWFFVALNPDFSIKETNSQEVAQMLVQLMKNIQTFSPDIEFTAHFKATANFDLNWGLGSSSTLVSLLSQWSGMDAQRLLKATFGGSGYDVACATASHPILYRNRVVIDQVNFSQEITKHLLFIYLGKKQNSREEIKRYERSTVTSDDVEKINNIITGAMEATTIEAFEEQLNASEELLAPLLSTTCLKQRLFKEYPYSIKSLGAWGGDFFLATYRDLNVAKEYFKAKGYAVQFTYNELIK